MSWFVSNGPKDETNDTYDPEDDPADNVDISDYTD